jgi:hypothetical protein
MNRTRFKTRRSGLSLPEVLISLSICALLLTAVAAAFSASASAIEVNDRFFRASQAARISLAQMLALIRRCESCNLPGYVAPTTSWSGSSINILYKDGITGAVVDNLYQFSGSPSNQLQLVTNGNTVPLAHNVSAVTFTTDMAQNAGHVMIPVNVTVDITVQINEQQVHIRGSAVPRQVVYQ